MRAGIEPAHRGFADFFVREPRPSIYAGCARCHCDGTGENGIASGVLFAKRHHKVRQVQEGSKGKEAKRNQIEREGTLRLFGPPYGCLLVGFLQDKERFLPFALIGNKPLAIEPILNAWELAARRTKIHQNPGTHTA
jgi:hypothetical protein